MSKNKPKIIFLDAGTVDYGDLSLEPLSGLGQFQAHFSTKPEEIESKAKEAEILILNKCRFHKDLLEKLPRLKGIFVTATGTDNIDLQAAKSLGIAVANVPGYSTPSVVQLTLGFLTALANNLVKFNQAAHNGSWAQSPFFVLGAYPIRELNGKKLGIIGYGAIGQGVARVAKALGMEILVAKIPGRSYSKKESRGRQSLVSVLKQTDFVTIHAPLTPKTRDLISAEAISHMKKGTFLINMARGGIVNETALFEALKSGHLAGAATDVLTQEPPPHNHLLLGAPNLLMTPHVAWASLESRIRLVKEVALNLDSFLRGKKRNRVV